MNAVMGSKKSAKSRILRFKQDLEEFHIKLSNIHNSIGSQEASMSQMKDQLMQSSEFQGKSLNK